MGAVIDLQYCLDLLDTKSLGLVKNSYTSLKSFADTMNLELPVNLPSRDKKELLRRHLDCAVIENLHRIQRANEFRPFDSVRGVFVEGEELYPGAGFRDKNHIQICIRNPNCIQGFFIPKDEVKWVG